ncbi:hypothetical protein VB776_18510 [Arcicella sp. DC2W]|uniref:Uncharacterized protein n=1 Tax=Arcicella gelida TaxID=2984195 RepID=A0ABU5S8Y0_9BACT|nr:hypothetical protein [Arcicella sp. DC2W]MEA5404933.1 hypothetical protein [Arcicella sp. DC2W]
MYLFLICIDLNVIFYFERPYFSFLDERKVTKENQEIPNRIGEPTRSAQTAEFRKMLTHKF